MDRQHFLNDMIDEARRHPHCTVAMAHDLAFEAVLAAQERVLKNLRQQYQARLLEAIKDGRKNGWPVSVSV